MADTPIAVTGCTGRLGGRIARRLSAQGVAQRLIVRDAKRAPSLPGAEVHVATYRNRDALARALEGVRTALFVSAKEAPTRLEEHFAFIETAAAVGVETLVYTSFYGAAPNATFTFARDHWATEQRLREQRFSSVMLRDNLYLDFLPMMAGEDGVLRGPAGHGRVAAVAQDDIADVATAVLLNPREHRGRTYSLTGPESLTLDEVAAVLSRKLGRPIRYQAESIEEAYRSRARYGAEQWQVDAWVSTYTAIAAGELADVTTDVERVARHAPMSLETLPLT
ncbi:SDR family oxidoreductase [Myxococcus sp. CA033]|uniref:SDR family oxidoreductase n=1 Tax=Myxococcus sp. CA033 TaxID=2741516 RepID=UPI00157A73B5|nr:SDR family oxidoreductase [Myxococcus sp. CA033]NTX41138.1 SDR family oxidoreductase [Myxococcus sp. CA033]